MHEQRKGWTGLGMGMVVGLGIGREAAMIPSSEGARTLLATGFAFRLQARTPTAGVLFPGPSAFVT